MATDEETNIILPFLLARGGTWGRLEISPGTPGSHGRLPGSANTRTRVFHLTTRGRPAHAHLVSPPSRRWSLQGQRGPFSTPVPLPASPPFLPRPQCGCLRASRWGPSRNRPAVFSLLPVGLPTPHLRIRARRARSPCVAMRLPRMRRRRVPTRPCVPPRPTQGSYEGGIASNAALGGHGPGIKLTSGLPIRFARRPALTPCGNWNLPSAATYSRSLGFEARRRPCTRHSHACRSSCALVAMCT